MNSYPTLEAWQQRVIGQLPPAAQVAEHNAVINAHYARWYQGFRFFKWAGMAAYSSHRVGLALSPYEIIADAEQILEIRNRKGELQQDASLIPDCNLLRLTNNAVYKDIGWGHEAYALEGLPAIEAAIGSNPGYQALLEGFRLIDRGRRLSESARNSAEGQDLIWRGNVQLLWHEQAVVIQPFLKLLSLDYDRFLTALTVLTYWTSPFQIHPEKMTAFYLAMVAFGKMMLARTRSLPNFRNLDQRWFWIVQRAVPIFRRLDGHDPEILEGIAEIIRAGAFAGWSPQAVQPAATAR